MVFFTMPGCEAVSEHRRDSMLSIQLLNSILSTIAGMQVNIFNLRSQRWSEYIWRLWCPMLECRHPTWLQHHVIKLRHMSPQQWNYWVMSECERRQETSGGNGTDATPPSIEHKARRSTLNCSVVPPSCCNIVHWAQILHAHYNLKHLRSKRALVQNNIQGTT